MSDKAPLALPLRVQVYQLMSTEQKAGIFDADGKVVCEYLTPEAAEFIVSAVNSRDGLVEALNGTANALVSQSSYVDFLIEQITEAGIEQDDMDRQVVHAWSMTVDYALDKAAAALKPGGE